MNRTKNSPDETLHPQQGAVRKVKRFRWTKRIVLVLLILVVGLVVLWFWWDAQGDREIQAEIDRYRAAGQPIDPADFDPPPIDDKDNAALVLQDAISVLKLDPTQEDLIVDFPEVFVSENLEGFGKIVAENKKVFALVSKARAMKQADWGMRLDILSLGKVLPKFKGLRKLVSFLRASALYYHHAGDDVAAVDALRGAVATARSLNAQPFMVFYLCTLPLDAAVCEGIEEIAPGLEFPSLIAASRAPNDRDCKADVLDLISELLDEKGLQKTLQGAFYAERAYLAMDPESSLAAASMMAPAGWKTTISRELSTTVLKPLARKDVVRMLRIWTTLAEATAEGNWPSVQKKLPADYRGKDSFWGQLARPISSGSAFFEGRIFVLHFRNLALRRMAAVALAIRLYELDHGKRPEKLTELVPKYLPAVPEDPFAADGRAIGYLPHAPRPLLYSVSVNGIDQGGKYAESPDHRPVWNAYDIPLFLNGDRPRRRAGTTSRPARSTLPTTQPGPASQPSGLDQSQHSGE